MSQEDRRTQVYILVCRNPEGEIIVPAFSAFDMDEAYAYFESESAEHSSSIYNCELLKIVKAFELLDGKVVWANREGSGHDGPPLYLTIDLGLRGKPFLYFNRLVSEPESRDLDSLHVARIY